MPEIEISHLDRRFEPLRLKDKYRENSLLQSIIANGVLQPVSCVFLPCGTVILLDGFKRVRCLEKLHLGHVQTKSLGEQEAEGIAQLIRLSIDHSLNTLEQAALLDILHTDKGMSVADIARTLDRSKSWVSIRLGMLAQMSDVARQAVFNGDFPVRNYLYTLRSFTRVKGISQEEADDFVKTVKGKQLSTREIDTLANAFFQGGESFKQQIKHGNLDWILRKMKNQSDMAENLENKLEIKVIRNLELVQKYINHIVRSLSDPQLKSADFKHNACIIIEGILNKMDNFTKILKEFYDQGTY